MMKKMKEISIVILMLALIGLVFYILKLEKENEIFKGEIHAEKQALENDLDLVLQDLHSSQEENFSISKDFKGVKNKLNIVTSDLSASDTKLKLIKNKLHESEQRVRMLKETLINSKENNLKVLRNLRSELEELTINSKFLFKSLDSIKTLNDSLTVVVAITKSELNVEKRESKKLAFKLSEATKVQISNVSVFGVEEKKSGEIKVTSRHKKVNAIELKYNVLNNKALKNTEANIFCIVKNSDNLIIKSTGEFMCNGVVKKFTDVNTLILNGETMPVTNVISLKDVSLAKGIYFVEIYGKDGLLAKESFVLKNSFLGVF